MERWQYESPFPLDLARGVDGTDTLIHCRSIET